ncbi:MAG: 4-hydroxybutyrate--acetyl-CoA CoA transferase [Oscillospiraceae bacterium]|nr:4-hydroxybutyrate--acetyl-CoA CoA transferase [Oscillospiraceae bacterium]
MDLQNSYHDKFITMDEALSQIKSGDVIAVAAYGNEPVRFLRRLHEIRDRGVRDVTLWLANPQEEYPFLKMEGMEDVISILSIFYGKSLRDIHSTGRVSFVPNNLHGCVDAMLRTRKPNVFVGAVTPVDRFGYVCMSTSQQFELELFDTCETVMLEINPALPHIAGTTRIPVDKVHYFLEGENTVVNSPVYPKTEIQETIADYAASLIHDGDTLQLGIGGMPDAVAERLTDRQDMGIYTEMLGSAMGKLMACGAVNNSRKTFFRNRSVAAFTWGTKELYDYIDDNPMVELLPVGYVNDPRNIMKNENMVSVNTALEIDLTGQVCSETIAGKQYSGTGGAWDFAYGAFHAKNGRGIIALQSTAKSGTISRIVPRLTAGNIVTIPRNIVDIVVTEYGVAHLRGKSVRQRVEELIAVAHPDFRQELREQARKLEIW